MRSVGRRPWMGRPVIRVAVSTLVLATALAGGPVGAQGPMMGATAKPADTPAPGEPTLCPVTQEGASAIAGVPMQWSPMSETPPGGLDVTRSPRVPGGDLETTDFECTWYSEEWDGHAAPSRELFLWFAVGESADYLWDIDGPGIEADPTYAAVVDGDPTTPDTYTQRSVYLPDGQAFEVRTVQVRQRVHADGLFGDTIVTVEGEDVTEDQVELMADQVALALVEAVGPPPAP